MGIEIRVFSASSPGKRGSQSNGEPGELPGKPMSLRTRAGSPQVMRLVGSDLTCVRGGREVFRGVAFTVGAGEALLVTGPNGAGKSSLLRLVAGLVRPQQGRIELEGCDLELTIGEQAHYLGHQDALKPSLSVQENLDFWAHFLGGGAGKRDAALATVGLDGLAQLP